MCSYEQEPLCVTHTDVCVCVRLKCPLFLPGVHTLNGQTIYSNYTELKPLKVETGMCSIGSHHPLTNLGRGNCDWMKLASSGITSVGW